MKIDPENLLNFRLWRLVSLAGAPVTRLCEGRYGITRREWHLLAMLARDGPLSPSEIALRASLDRARVSKAIASLIEKSLMQRTAVRDDRCRAVLTLTPKGINLANELFPQIDEINERVLSAISPEAREALFASLEALTRQAVEINRENASEVQADRHRGGSRRRWVGRSTG
ncbi:MarR family winged helix-turn-helix transcriptional regulator [Variovorax terrae]|uniref:MarR family transcriptional regulator n=1 Tax=Variovorax terrae TaxID=2923278 RepID=A0A9X1VXJ6_9BURK|nr:MarR family transcriptional regulator [Variovorax terrae]MCJ0765115.1 MarR family transcriptional regulator [Variovorax terrae]